MHPTTARYLAQAYRDDREREAARDRLAASVRNARPTAPGSGRAASVGQFVVALFRRPVAAAR